MGSSDPARTVSSEDGSHVALGGNRSASGEERKAPGGPAGGTEDSPDESGGMPSPAPADGGSGTVSVFGAQMSRSTLFRAVGLALFLIVLVAATVAMWPVISSVFSESGRQNMVDEIQNAGPVGVLILLGFEIVQVIVAVIPGEVVQLVAGMLYGPWGGAAIVLAGCVISTWLIYELVHRLGQPFVEEVVSTEHLQRFRDFEESGKLSTLVFVLFLIPGLPKDTFTYLVPLTSMKLKEYLLLTTVARSPGVVMSTFAAAGFVNGNIWQSALMLGIVGVVALVAIVKRDKIFELMHRGK